MGQINNKKKNNEKRPPYSPCDLLFPKRKITFFEEIYDQIEQKLMSTNYFMLPYLLPIRGNTLKNLCWNTEDGTHHIFFT